jgi:DSF synthase
VSYEELLNIANLWVSAALRLEEKDLRLMSRLARSQSKRVPGGAAAMPEAAEMVEQEQYATA